MRWVMPVAQLGLSLGCLAFQIYFTRQARKRYREATRHFEVVKSWHDHWVKVYETHCAYLRERGVILVMHTDN